MQKLIRFLQRLVAEKFYGTITIKFENGKATHIEMASMRKWEYKEFP